MALVTTEKEEKEKNETSSFVLFSLPFYRCQAGPSRYESSFRFTRRLHRVYTVHRCELIVRRHSFAVSSPFTTSRIDDTVIVISESRRTLETC